MEAVGHSAGLARTGSVRWARRVTPHIRAVFEVVFFVLFPLIGPAMVFQYLIGTYQVHPITVDGTYFPDGGFLFDLHVMWDAGHDIVTGSSPYPFVYPAPAAFLMVPFGLLPWPVAVVAFSLFVIGGLFLTFRLLEVRDWRCYGAALAAMPCTSAVTIGTLSTFLPLCAAIAWRYRNRRWPVALAVAAAVVTKLFLWPLVVWLIATRRFRTAATTVGVGVFAVFGSWAILGFDGMLDYPRRLGRIAGIEQERSYSPFALLRSLGISETAAHAAVAVLTVVGLLVIVALARRRDGDRLSFAAAIAVGLVASPIVWLHYLVLIYVVIALYRKRLAVAWLIPLLYWILPGQDAPGGTSVILTAYAITLGAAAAAMLPRSSLVSLGRRPVTGLKALVARAP